MSNEKNSDVLNPGQVDAIADLARKAAEVRKIADTKGLIAVPEGINIFDQDTLHVEGSDASLRIERVEKLYSGRAFADYVTAYGTSSTAIFIDERAGSATAFMNYIPTAAATRKKVTGYRFDWVATLETQYSSEYELLTNISQSGTDPAAIKLALLKLRDNLSVYDSSIKLTEKTLSLELMNENELMSTMLEAPLASEDDIIAIISNDKKMPKRSLIYLSLPIFDGNELVEIPLVLDTTSAKWSMTICGARELEQSTRRRTVQFVKSKLGLNFPVFAAKAQQGPNV